MKWSFIDSIRVLLYAATLGMAIGFLWHFSNIVRFGQQTIQEPNTAILIGEILLVGLVLMATIAMIIIDFKSLLVEGSCGRKAGVLGDKTD